MTSNVTSNISSNGTSSNGTSSNGISSNVMNGLATYEIFKTAGTLIVLILVLFSCTGWTIYNINLNYLSTSGDIKLGPDNLTETLIYNIDGIEYRHIIQPVKTTTNNVTSINPAYTPGPCKVYYPQSNPNQFTISVLSPTTFSKIGVSIVCCLVFFTFIWLMFLRKNKNVAGVIGGVNVAQSVLNPIRYN